MKLDKSILEPVYFVDEFYAPIFRMLDKSGDEYTVIDKAGSVIVNKKWADANGISDINGFIEYCKAHPGEVLRLQVQAPAAGVDAGRTLLPERFLDAQGLPQARLQVIDDLLARHLLDGGGKDVRAQAVVAVARAGLILQRPFHEAAHPVAVPAAGGAGRVGSVAGVHRQEMPDGDPLQGV